MKRSRVFRKRNRRNRRSSWRTWLPLIALISIIGGTALIARAIRIFSDDNVQNTDATPSASSSTSTTSGISSVTTTTSGVSSVTTTTQSQYETSFVATTTTTTKKKTTTTTTKLAGGLSSEGHFVQQREDVPWNLVLANPWNPLPDGFDKKLDLKGNLKGFSHEKVDVRIYESIEKMLADGSKYNLSICSGYRSVEKQTALFEGRVSEWMNKGYSRKEAEAKVLKDTAYPGTSEHNTGLAVDLLGDGYTWLSENFADTDAYEWLIDNCSKYGFILRYPKGREDTTGYTFEPWHYRYVGVEAAGYIMENNLTLEEYLEQQNG